MVLSWLVRVAAIGLFVTAATLQVIAPESADKTSGTNVSFLCKWNLVLLALYSIIAAWNQLTEANSVWKLRSNIFTAAVLPTAVVVVTIFFKGVCSDCSNMPADWPRVLLLINRWQAVLTLLYVAFEILTVKFDCRNAVKNALLWGAIFSAAYSVADGSFANYLPLTLLAAMVSLIVEKLLEVVSGSFTWESKTKKTASTTSTSTPPAKPTTKISDALSDDESAPRPTTPKRGQNRTPVRIVSYIPKESEKQAANQQGDTDGNNGSSSGGAAAVVYESEVVVTRKEGVTTTTTVESVRVVQPAEEAGSVVSEGKASATKTTRRRSGKGKAGSDLLSGDDDDDGMNIPKELHFSAPGKKSPGVGQISTRLRSKTPK